MAPDDDDFKIKGAASSSNSSSRQASVEHQPGQLDDTASGLEDGELTEAEEVNSKAGGSDGQQTATETAEQLAKYRWYQCDTTPSSEYKYYYHCDTQETSWEMPPEPYWVYDSVTQQVDPVGLQYPARRPSRAEALGLDKPETKETYTGYNPKIHGNYDPNADYAKYHNQKRAEEAAAFRGSYAPIPGTAMYESTMTLNRFTGNAQAADLGPERHSDHAKSGRQMGAFFDVDAAANAHGGKSLKEERTNQKITKKQVKKFQEAKKQKKREKQMAFYLS